MQNQKTLSYLSLLSRVGVMANTRNTSISEYKEFTFGWLIFAFIIPIHAVLTYFYLNSPGVNGMGFNEYLVVTFVFILVCILFYGLTTKINSEAIIVSFGVGLIRKKIKLDRIRSVKTVRSPWYYGWGLRIIPGGMLYNISGFEGVELTFHDTNRIMRIGTKDSLRLKNEIEKRRR